MCELEKAAMILSKTLTTFSLPGGRDRRERNDRKDRLFSCFSARSLSSLFLSLASFLSALLRCCLSSLSRSQSSSGAGGASGRSSWGTKPGGYETMWIECGRRRRGSISGAGKGSSGRSRRLRAGRGPSGE